MYYGAVWMTARGRFFGGGDEILLSDEETKKSLLTFN